MPAYNTVLTLLRIMEKKGYVSHTQDGRAFIFQPTVDRADASRSALQSSSTASSMGHRRLLMLNLLEDGQFSPEALKQLKERIEEA